MRRKRRSKVEMSLLCFQDIITSVTGVMMLILMMVALDLTVESGIDASEQTIEINHLVRSQIAESDRRLNVLEGRLTRSVVDSRVFRARADLEELLETVDDEIGRANQKAMILTIQQAQTKGHAAAANRLEQQIRANFESLRQIESKIVEVNSKQREMKSSEKVFYNLADSVRMSGWIFLVEESGLRVGRMGEDQGVIQFRRFERFVSWIRQLDAEENYIFVLIKPGGSEIYRQYLEFLRSNGFRFGFDLLIATQSPF